METRGRPQRPARPALAQRLQMLLLALDQQDLLVDPAQEEGLGHRGRDLLVPEVLHVLGFEVGEDLVADVVPGELAGLGRGRRLGGPRPLPRWPLCRAQDDGQRVRRDLQKLLHLPKQPAPPPRGPLSGPPLPPAAPGNSRQNVAARQAGSVSAPTRAGAGRAPTPPPRAPAAPDAPRSPRVAAPGRGRCAEPARARAPARVTCSSGPPSGHRSFPSGGTLGTLASPGARLPRQGAETREEEGSSRRVRGTLWAGFSPRNSQESEVEGVQGGPEGRGWGGFKWQGSEESWRPGWGGAGRTATLGRQGFPSGVSLLPTLHPPPPPTSAGTSGLADWLMGPWKRLLKKISQTTKMCHQSLLPNSRGTFLSCLHHVLWACYRRNPVIPHVIYTTLL